MKIDLEKIERLYTEGIEKYGFDSRSVGWKDKESQLLRFEKLVEVIEDRSRMISVNELGVGYGAMFNFLLERGFNVKKFFGYDISKRMLEAAKDFVKDERAEFIQSDKIEKKADYSFASGIFNVKFDIPENLWKEYIEHILSNMNEHSQKGFSFNLLTTYVDYREKHLYYGNPFYFFDFCKRNFSKKVSLLHDYDLWEWTILVKKI
jgi:SAM-dependent methyltransferase